MSGEVGANMSRAFVKEQHIDTVEHLPDRPVSEHPNSSRPPGKRQIEKRFSAEKAEAVFRSVAGARAIRYRGWR